MKIGCLFSALGLGIRAKHNAEACWATSNCARSWWECSKRMKRLKETVGKHCIKRIVVYRQNNNNKTYSGQRLGRRAQKKEHFVLLSVSAYIEISMWHRTRSSYFLSNFSLIRADLPERSRM